MNESKIKFVRKYDFYGKECFEVIYNSGRVVTYWEKPIPATVKAFISNKTPYEQYDKIFHRTELIFDIERGF